MCKPALEKAVNFEQLSGCQGAIVVDPGYLPVSNGCGTSGWKGLIVPDNPFGFQFQPCCTIHDECYGTCLKAQQVCDGDFGQCLDGVCYNEVPPEQQNFCIFLATVYHNYVVEYGQIPWQNGQVAGCACCGTLPNP